MNDLLIYSNAGLWIVQLFIVFCLFIIFRQFGTVYLRDKESVSRDGIPIGKKIPNFEAKSMITDKVMNKENFLGKPTIIGFISTRCKPCKELIPDWNKAYDKYNGQINFVLIGIGEEENLKKFANEKNVKGELLIDAHYIVDQFYARVTHLLVS